METEMSSDSPQPGSSVRFSSVRFGSVTQVCLTLCDPMDCSTPGLPVHHQLPKFTQTESVMPSNHLILCRPLLLLPSIFPSIGVFSNESALHIRWSKYWSFSFSISPFNEHPGLISFRMDWLDPLAVKKEGNSVSPVPLWINLVCLKGSVFYVNIIGKTQVEEWEAEKERWG